MKIRPVVPSGQTDGYDKAKSHFSQFCKRAWNWLTYCECV